MPATAADAGIWPLDPDGAFEENENPAIILNRERLKKQEDILILEECRRLDEWVWRCAELWECYGPPDCFCRSCQLSRMWEGDEEEDGEQQDEQGADGSDSTGIEGEGLECKAMINLKRKRCANMDHCDSDSSADIVDFVPRRKLVP